MRIALSLTTLAVCGFAIAGCGPAATPAPDAVATASTPLVSAAKEASGSGTGALPAIPWMRSHDQALALAKKLQKPLLIDFWCGTWMHCATIDNGPLSNQAVRALAAGFVPLRLDQVADASWFTHYAVDGIGVFLIAGPSGEILDEVLLTDLRPEPMTTAFRDTLAGFLEHWPAIRDAAAEK